MKYLIAILFVSFNASAQELPVSVSHDSTIVFPINEVIVSATRSAKPAAEVGRSVTIISAGQIKNSAAVSIGELIGRQPGMFVVGAGQNPGMTQTIFTRGASSNHTTVMVDGVRIADPSTVNNAPDLSELSFIGMDRLEIVRGSHSTLFGSSAIGGVMNFISQRSSKQGLHINAEGSSGMFGKKTFFLGEDVAVQFTDNTGLYVNTGFSNAAVQGLDATVDTVKNPLVFKNRDRDGFHKLDAYGKIGYDGERFDIHFSYKYNTQQTDIDRSAYVDDNNYTLDFKRSLYTFGASYAVNDLLDLQYIGGISAMNRTSVNDSSVVDRMGTFDHSFYRSLYEGTTISHELQNNFTLNGFDGVIGTGLYNELMNNSVNIFSWSSYGVYRSDSNLDSLDLHSSTKSLFLHVNISGEAISSFLRDLSVSVGGRYNHHDAFGTNATYELRPSFRVFTNGLLFASYSTGFNAPSLYQLYAPDTYYTSTVTRGNKNLKPERSASFEIGFRQQLGKSVNVSATYFNSVIENYIEYVYLWDKHIGIDTLANDFLRDDYRGDSYLNLGTQNTRGVELTVNALVMDHWHITADVSIVTGELNYRASDINAVQTQGNHVQIYANGAFLTRSVTSKGLVRRPSTAHLQIQYSQPEFFMTSVDLTVVGPRDDVYYESSLGPFGALNNVTVPGYFLLDLSHKQILSDSFSLIGRVENIFDTKYSEINGFTTRGRGVFLKLSYSM